ncbi:MAG TPA: hypothetical protein V6C63_05490, partial [Allocoleopsis sp.]
SQEPEGSETQPAPTASVPTDSAPAISVPPAALTSLQTEVLYCLLALLTVKQASSEVIAAELPADSAASASGTLPELKTWAETMARSQPDTYDVTKLPELQAVTVDEARQLLIEAGFSGQAVDEAWQLIEAAGPMPPLT